MSPWRLARPVLVFGILVALMVAMLVHSLVPLARARLADRQAEIAQNVTAQFLRAGSFQYPVKGVTLYIRDIKDDGRLVDFFLEDGRDPNEDITYTATEALVVRTADGPRLVLMQGMVQSLSRAGGRHSLAVTRFSELAYDLATLINPEASRKRDLRTYSTRQLLQPDAALLEATGATPAAARAEAHERLAKHFQAPVAAMLGFATLLIGSYSRFGVWRQVIWAVVALIGVQFLQTAAESQVARDPDQWPLIYISPLVGAGVGVFLLWLAARPRRLCNKSRAPEPEAAA